MSQFPTEHSLIADFELMFNNARHYNEENSAIYKDADMLERVLRNKIRSLGPLDGSPAASGKTLSGRKYVAISPNMSRQCKSLQSLPN